MDPKVEPPIDLTRIEQLPPSIAARLGELHAALRRRRSLERLLEDPAISAIAAALQQHCADRWIVGYHYTRAVLASIREHGLWTHAGAAMKETFLEEHGHRFTADQRQRIVRAWADYFGPSQDRCRNRKLWFALTLKPLSDGSADRLLRYFGGEVIYKPLASQPDIAAILMSIGEPVVVFAALESRRCRTFLSRPFGRVWLSTYHVSVNPAADRNDVDLYVTDPVGPEHLLDLVDARELGWADR